MKEIPYALICAAQRGDTEAILMIRRHFEGYVASKCLVTYDDGDGHSYTFPDDELSNYEKWQNASHRETYFATPKGACHDVFF